MKTFHKVVPVIIFSLGAFQTAAMALDAEHRYNTLDHKKTAAESVQRAPDGHLPGGKAVAAQVQQDNRPHVPCGGSGKDASVDCDDDAAPGGAPGDDIPAGQPVAD